MEREERRCQTLAICLSLHKEHLIFYEHDWSDAWIFSPWLVKNTISVSKYKVTRDTAQYPYADWLTDARFSLLNLNKRLFDNKPNVMGKRQGLLFSFCIQGITTVLIPREDTIHQTNLKQRSRRSQTTVASRQTIHDHSSLDYRFGPVIGGTFSWTEDVHMCSERRTIKDQ